MQQVWTQYVFMMLSKSNRYFLQATTYFVLEDFSLGNYKKYLIFYLHFKRLYIVCFLILFQKTLNILINFKVNNTIFPIGEGSFKVYLFFIKWTCNVCIAMLDRLKLSKLYSIEIKKETSIQNWSCNQVQTRIEIFSKFLSREPADLYVP